MPVARQVLVVLIFSHIPRDLVLARVNCYGHVDLIRVVHVVKVWATLPLRLFYPIRSAPLVFLHRCSGARTDFLDVKGLMLFMLL